jgi:hypothetical protein
VIKQAATGMATVQVLDVENAFAGHTVCDSPADANGAILPPSANDSFHPNHAGDFQLADSLLNAGL